MARAQAARHRTRPVPLARRRTTLLRQTAIAVTVRPLRRRTARQAQASIQRLAKRKVERRRAPQRGIPPKPTRRQRPPAWASGLITTLGSRTINRPGAVA
jgi:hypothetical protein